MRRIPLVWGIHADPTFMARLVLGLLLFIIVIGVYLWASYERHLENEQDKLLPTVPQMVEAAKTMALVKDVRTETYPLLSDTLATLRRLGMGIGISAVIGLLLGINLAVFRGLKALLLPFITFVSIVPPLALLPILFVTCGVEEFAKVTLIVIGITPPITISIYTYVDKIPREQTIKSLTLGASQLGIVYRIMLPQTLPKLIDSVRFFLGAAWLFLIAAEAIASTEGLGYRIFLVRRYMSMDVIIPYVLWITLLGFLFDLGLQYLTAWLYPWYVRNR